MPNKKRKDLDSVLILHAYLLDTYVEHPDGVVIANGDSEVLLSEIYAERPELRRMHIAERAKVYRQLGWEVPQ